MNPMSLSNTLLNKGRKTCFELIEPQTTKIAINLEFSFQFLEQGLILTRVTSWIKQTHQML